MWTNTFRMIDRRWFSSPNSNVIDGDKELARDQSRGGSRIKNLFRKSLDSIDIPKTLVLGSTGSLGHSICKDLAAVNGIDSVFKIDTCTEGRHENYYVHDAADSAFVENVVQKHKIDYIVCLAGMNALNADVDVDLTLSNCVSIADACLNAARKFNLRVIYVSTMDTLTFNYLNLFSNKNNRYSFSSYILYNDIVEKIYQSYDPRVTVLRVPKVVHMYNNRQLPYADFCSRMLVDASLSLNNTLEYGAQVDPTAFDYYLHNRDLGRILIDLTDKKAAHRKHETGHGCEFVNIKGFKLTVADLYEQIKLYNPDFSVNFEAIADTSTTNISQVGSGQGKALSYFESEQRFRESREQLYSRLEDDMLFPYYHGPEMVNYQMTCMEAFKNTIRNAKPVEHRRHKFIQV